MLELEGRTTASVRVDSVWRHDGRPVFKFVGIDSISEAEPWAGADILVAGVRAGAARGRRVFACGPDRLRGVESAIERWAWFARVEEYGGAPLLRV